MMPSSIDFESTWKFNFKVYLCRTRLFPILISKIKWLGYGLPLISKNSSPLDRIDPKEELYSSQVKFVYQHQPYLFADSTIQVYEVLVNQMTLLE